MPNILHKQTSSTSPFEAALTTDRLADYFMQRFGSPAAISSVPLSRADRPPLLIHDTLDGIDKKQDAPVVVCRTHVDDKFDSAYRDFVHVYTDESVERLHGTATAAFNIFAWGMQVSGHINFCTTFTTTDLCAMRLALQVLLHQPTPSGAGSSY